MQHHSYACTFPEGCNCGASRVNAMKEELTRLRAEVSRLTSEVARKDCRVISHRIDGGEAWLWQGDGDDHLESLTCPVVIHPEQLRPLIEDKERLDWLEAHPLKSAIHGGADDGSTGTFWGCGSANCTLRETIDTISALKS